MRILLSAYACEPDRGSEPGVGWNWAKQLAAAGHDVVVVTRANNQAPIESVLGRTPSNPRFLYYDLPPMLRFWKRGGRGVHLYYLLWQWGASRFVRAWMARTRQSFDCVHHITFGVFRHPSLMMRLAPRFIFGPVGGGEEAPWKLISQWPISNIIAESLRMAANSAARFDPFLRRTFAQSELILCKTPETLSKIPRRYRDRCRVQLELGVEREAIAQRPTVRSMGEPFRAVFVGRLLYWKGPHLALKAFAEFYATHKNAELTLIGRGPAERDLRELAARLGVDKVTRWVSHMPQAELQAEYSRHHALLFPSSHDSSANVVLEALAQGLPAITLDLGGPAQIVQPSCGLALPTGGCQESAVVAGLAKLLRRLAEDEAERQSLAMGALARAREFEWARVAASVYAPLPQSQTVAQLAREQRAGV